MPAGVTTDLAGNFNTAASLTVQYRPMTTAVSAVSKSVNGVVGGALAVSVATSLVAGKAACCNPAFRRQKLSWQLCCCRSLLDSAGCKLSKELSSPKVGPYSQHRVCLTVSM